MSEGTIEQALRLHQSQRFAEAEQLYRQILQQNPNQPNALNLLGLLAHQTGRLDLAVELLTRATQLVPDAHPFHFHLASALQAQGKLVQALAAVSRAAHLAPRDAAIQKHLGIALAANGRMEEAIAQFHKVVNLTPTDADAWYNLGTACLQRGLFKESIAALERSVELNSNYAPAHSNLGACYRAIGKFDEALAHYERAIALKPDYPEALYNLGALCHVLYRMPESMDYYRRALALRLNFPAAHSGLLMALHYEAPFDVERTFNEHLEWARRNADPLQSQIRPLDNSRDPNRRLRIGYVSPDLFQHSVTFFLEPILEHYDRDQFELFCYSDAVKSDDTTARLQQRATWRDIRNLPDDRVAQMIRDDKIDILIDLAGHTSNNRLLVFARKPAPVQVSYLGYPNTTGLRTIDYRITDELSDPPAQDRWYVEKLIRLPRTAWCYRPPADARDVVSRNSGDITFGSFNNLAKINEHVIATWSRILHNVAKSRLLIKAPTLQHTGVQQRLRDAFAKHGIEQSRLTLIGFKSYADHLALYHQVDVALDTFPYNGTTTTCESLWMGVPVVTLAGQHHVSRVGLSLLTNLGLEQCIAHDSDQYVRLATDVESLRSIRLMMRDQMRGSPLMDGSQFTRDFENIYRTIWKTWCES